VENRGNIRVTNARRRAGFAQKAKPRRFITEISLTDDFQCHGAVQIDVDRFVSDPHRTATQQVSRLRPSLIRNAQIDEPRLPVWA
jgi:hypothetical protein